jgi:Short C-terminal domain
MSSVGLAKWSFRTCILMMVVAVPGFILILVLDAFFLDEFDAYGEVAIPGSGSVHLPRGEVTVSFHTVVVGSPNGGLPVPPLGVTFTPPDGVAQPVVTENIGSTTTVNNDAHVRVWTAQIPADGTYNVTTDGQVNGFINPHLAFGHSSSLGFLVWVFVAMFVVGLVGSIVSAKWSGRARRKAAAAVVGGFPHVVMPPRPMTPATAPSAAYEPSGEGVRLERLKTLASLRDSGALTEEEFQAEKRRILGGG